jgi:nucleoside-diphosphate-sugar epimerase
MPEPGTALVAGASGAVGTPLVSLLRERGWRVAGVCRRPPAELGAFRHLPADLQDAGACRDVFARVPEVTHVVYAARAPFGEGGVESVADNVAMLTNVIDAAEAAFPGLAHLHLVEGDKWYGLHLGPYPTPAREDDPRHLPPNFYYDQEDLLAARSGGRPWRWSASRPNVVCDFAPGRGRNLVSILGAYAAICREMGAPLDYPGTAASFESLTEVTDARLLAEAVLFMATEPRAADQAFNVSNGDLFRWSRFWPALARHLDLVPGIPRPLRLSAWMADKEPVWQEIVRRHGLAPSTLDQVAAWGFADFVFGQEWDVAADTGRLRRAGFCGCVDSLAMFRTMLERYRAARILP